MQRDLTTRLILCLLCFCGVAGRSATAQNPGADTIRVIVTEHDGTPVENIGVLVLGQDAIESPSSVEYHELPRAITDARGVASFDAIDHDGTVHVQLADAVAFIGESPDTLRDLTARFRQLAREVPIRSTYPIDVGPDGIVNLRLDTPAFVKIATEEVASKRYPMIATWAGSSPRVYAAGLEPNPDGFVSYPIPADEDVLVIASFPGHWIIDAVVVPAGATHEVESLAPRLNRATEKLAVTIDASPDLDFDSAMGYSNLVTIWSRESGIALMGRYIPARDGFVFMQPGGTMTSKAALPRGTLVATRGAPLFLGWAIPGFGAQASNAFAELAFEGKSPRCAVFEPEGSEQAATFRLDGEGFEVQHPETVNR